MSIWNKIYNFLIRIYHKLFSVMIKFCLVNNNYSVINPEKENKLFIFIFTMFLLLFLFSFYCNSIYIVSTSVEDARYFVYGLQIIKEPNTFMFSKFFLILYFQNF